MKTKSIGKVFSCFDCSVKIKNELREHLKCPVIEMDPPINFESGIFHDDCPFEDHETSCDCEPFQPCEKCAKKTEWKPLKISEMQVMKTYWIADINNLTGKAYRDEWGSLTFSECDSGLGDPVMIAEIKPPEPPK
jgi:hypothetical protein